ncbi:MAG: hypothetical protein ACSLFQ_00815 [Thermoanaerobaculia bacterium]
MRIPGPFNRTLASALVVLGILGLQGCITGPKDAKPKATAGLSNRTVTICGTVEEAVRSDSADGVSTLLTLIDSRSGFRFLAEIPASARPAFEKALGTTPEIAYAGTSVCATGILHDEGTPPMFELARPEDVTINSRRQ